MVGLFTILGVVTGSALASLGVAMNDFTLPTIALGVIEFITMLSLFFRLDEGRKAKDRGGRSWPTIAKEAWGTDILRERSFVFLVASRFFILGGSAFLITLAVPYLERALGMVDEGERASWIFITTLVAAGCTAVATIPRRTPVAAGRTQAGHLRCLRGRGAGHDDRGIGAHGAAPCRRGDLRRRRCRELPRRRLGADDRHHPEGLIGSLHGHLERRDGDERGHLDDRRWDHHRRVRAGRLARRRPSVRVPRSGRSGWRSGRCCCGRSTNDGARVTPRCRNAVPDVLVSPEPAG